EVRRAAPGSGPWRSGANGCARQRRPPWGTSPQPRAGTLRPPNGPVKSVFTEYLWTETGAVPVGVQRAQLARISAGRRSSAERALGQWTELVQPPVHGSREEQAGRTDEEAGHRKKLRQRFEGHAGAALDGHEHRGRQERAARESHG